MTNARALLEAWMAGRSYREAALELDSHWMALFRYVNGQQTTLHLETARRWSKVTGIAVPQFMVPELADWRRKLQ